MDGIIDLPSIVQRETAEYTCARDWKGKSYSVEDQMHHIYTAVFVPNDHPLLQHPRVSIMERVVGDKVVLEEDKTDRPLYEALVAAGVPAEQIVAAYAGDRLGSEVEAS